MYDDGRWPWFLRAGFYGLRVLVVVFAVAPWWGFATTCFGDPKPRYDDFGTYRYEAPGGYGQRKGLGESLFPGLYRCGAALPSILEIVAGLALAFGTELAWRRMRSDLMWRL